MGQSLFDLFLELGVSFLPVVHCLCAVYHVPRKHCVNDSKKMNVVSKIIVETTMVKILKTCCSVHSEAITTRVDTMEQQDNE